jgi:hypothetical protein
VEYQHDQIIYCHQCLRSILQNLLSAYKNKHSHELYIHSFGKTHAHFKHSLVINDTGLRDMTKSAHITVPLH